MQRPSQSRIVPVIVGPLVSLTAAFGCNADDSSSAAPPNNADSGSESGGSAGASGGGSPGAGGGTPNGGAVSSGGAAGAPAAGGGPGAGGTAGTGGNSTGSGGGGAGSGGTGSGGSPTGNACPPAPHTSPSGMLSATRIDAVPPMDGYFSGGGVLEGPVWIDGSLYVSHFPYGSTPKSRIVRFTPPSDVTVVSPAAGTNGLAVDANGDLIAGRHENGTISRFPLSDIHNPVPLVTTFDSKRFNSPNDLTLRSDGNLYFTDPSYQAPATAPQLETRVYRVAPTGDVSSIDESLDQPNGITLSLDESVLYVATPSNLFRYDVDDGGAVANRSQFAGGGSDGMGLDCAGNLYVTRDRTVIVLDASAQEIARISVNSAGSTTNVAFGGPEGKTLFITTLGDLQQLFSVELPIAGLPY